MKVFAELVVLGCCFVQIGVAQESPSRVLAEAVVKQGYSNVLQMAKSGGGEGVLLDGMAAEWHTTADGQDFYFIKDVVDQYVTVDGVITGGAAPDDLGLGSAVLLMYRVTQEKKYYLAAKSLYRQSELETSGEYRGEAFRATYAATFQEWGAFDGIARELLSVDFKKPGLRKTSTGLMHKTAGVSQEVLIRAMGLYAMSLVDALDWFPADHPQRPELIEALNRTAAGMEKFQDAKTGLWGQRGSRLEKGASTNDMCVYALAKGVRMGYVAQRYAANARRGWEVIQKESLVGEVGQHDIEAMGAFLLAGSEMEQSDTEVLGQGKTVLVDAWFNSQTRKNAAGQTELFHYKWDDDANSGFSFFGRAFQRYGVRLATEKTAPTAEDLKEAQVYILASPDIPVKNPNPHYMDKASGDVIKDWVKAGGVLLLMENDQPNSEFEHFNTLSERFGIHFNPVLRNHVTGNDIERGKLMIPPGTGVFEHPHQAYMKDTCSIAVKLPATAVVSDKGDVMIALARYGKGTVFAVVDPWVYNEYTDRRNHFPVEYDTFAAAIDLAGWAVRQAHSLKEKGLEGREENVSQVAGEFGQVGKEVRSGRFEEMLDRTGDLGGLMVAEHP